MKKRFKLISCEVFTRELCRAVSESPHEVDLQFLPKGLHDLGAQAMVEEVQRTLDDVNESLYDAILFGYGMCNNGLVGIRARHIPLVVPRAHDCITIFLGSRDRYLEEFNRAPGTYYLTTGWVERGSSTHATLPSQLSLNTQTGLDRSFEEFVEEFGEEEAEYLWDMLGRQTAHYERLVFIEMGVEPDDSAEVEARRRADKNGLAFEKLRGSMTILERLVRGEWDDDFLVVNPGNAIAADYLGGIAKAVPAPPESFPGVSPEAI